MVNARHFLREETQHVACISVSILSYTKRGVRRETYHYIIGKFYRPLGKRWRKRKKQKQKVD